VSYELDKLIETIRSRIIDRGFYFLMDDRLDLLCGPGCSTRGDEPEITNTVNEFAARHDWQATYDGSGYIFRPL
jgi:hypothetical protein